MIDDTLLEKTRILEELNRDYPIDLNESLENYDFDELLGCLEEGVQEYLLSLPELPIGYLIDCYKYSKSLEYQN